MEPWASHRKGSARPAPAELASEPRRIVVAAWWRYKMSSEALSSRATRPPKRPRSRGTPIGQGADGIGVPRLAAQNRGRSLGMTPPWRFRGQVLHFDFQPHCYFKWLLLLTSLPTRPRRTWRSAGSCSPPQPEE